MDLTGTTFKRRYTLKRRVGEGGMADVYLAADRDRDAPLVVKVLKPELSGSVAHALFKREAQILRTLEHPNIVRFYEVDSDRGYFFMVMDWVDGPNLKQEIERKGRPFSVSQVGICLRHVAAALHYAHGEELYHCDIKPSNILVRDGKTYLLADFGIARIAGDNFEAGTPYYMAPEQFVRGERISAQTDVYSLGITIFELLAGQAPFTGKTAPSQKSSIRQRVRWEHFNRQVPSLRAMNPSIPSQVERVITVALDKNPARRFPGVRDFRSAFDAARTGQGDGGATSFDGGHKEAKPRSVSVVLSRSKPAGRPHLEIRGGQWAGMYAAIPQRGLRIGRLRGNDLRLEAKSVSRKHALIWRKANRLVIEDLESSLGTYVNARRIRGLVALRNGDRIQIGQRERFVFRRG